MGTEMQSAILPVLRGPNGNEGSVMPGSMQGKSSGCCYNLYEPKGTQRRQSYLVALLLHRQLQVTSGMSLNK